MALAEESTALSSSWRPDTFRGTAGFFRAAQDAHGRWWLADPVDRPVFAKAVHGVRAAGELAEAGLPPDSASRLRTWGFNAVGVADSGVGPDDGLPFMASVEFCDAAAAVVGPGVRLPDVFDPAWPQRAKQHASARCAAYNENTALLGWVTDRAAAWAPPSLAGRPSLLQLCLSLEPTFAAYHAAWEFVLALHGGRLESVARAWSVALANKEVVRELTRAEEGIGTRGYLRDDARWTREFARRYFTSTAAAIRAADPNHLNLGCRFNDVAGPHVLVECTYPSVDVAMPDWREIPPPAAAPRTVAGVGQNPVLAGNVNWTTPEFLKLPVAARLLRLTSVEWMLRRARTALDRLARHPAVIGYAWGQWQDEPVEQPPFARGLVHHNGCTAREHTELLTQFNRRADLIRRSPLPSATS